MQEQWYLAEWGLQDELSVRLNGGDEHRTCYDDEAKEAPMRVEEPNGNLRLQMENVVNYYIRMQQGGKIPSQGRKRMRRKAGREDTVPRKKKNEKKNPNVRSGMRKSDSARCDQFFKCYMVKVRRNRWGG
jgi:hypothetical protein